MTLRELGEEEIKKEERKEMLPLWFRSKVLPHDRLACSQLTPRELGEERRMGERERREKRNAPALVSIQSLPAWKADVLPLTLRELGGGRRKKKGKERRKRKKEEGEKKNAPALVSIQSPPA